MENQTLHIDKESVSYEIEMRTRDFGEIKMIMRDFGEIKMMMRDFGEIKGHLRSITSYRMHPVHSGPSAGQDFGNGDDYQDYRGILNSYSQTQVSLDMR